MDYRRCFGLRAPRPIGDSTILVPQLENYSLFASPFLDISKKIGKLIEGGQQDVKSQSEEDSPVKRVTRQRSKKKEDGQKLSKEPSRPGDNFGIVLNVVTVKPQQLSITVGEGNEIEVRVKQDKVKSEYGGMLFDRNCNYKYELPDDVDKKSLVALWTSDEYLIILPGDNLREELLKESVRVPEELAESPGIDVAPPVETTGSKDPDEKVESKPETSKSEETEPKSSRSKDDSEKTKSKKVSGQDADEFVAKEVFDKSGGIPVHPVTRMLRPGLDIFMLRKYMVDLESYVSTARKFIENSSFVSENSKTAERCIRFLAKAHADKCFEETNLKGEIRRIRKKRENSPDTDSGYTSHPNHSDDSSKVSTLKKSCPTLTDLLESTSKE